MKTLSTLECAIITLMIALNTIFLNIPKILLTTNGNGAFLNCTIIGCIIFIWTLLITHLLKKFPSLDIIDISKYLGGKKLQFIIGISFITIIFLFIILSISHLVVLLKTIYFIKSPIFYILLFITIPALFTNLIGFSSIKNSNCFFFPIALLTLFILLNSKIDISSISKITPLLGNSKEDMFNSLLPNTFIFTNLFTLLFFPPLLRSNSISKIGFISFLFSWLFYLLTTLALLTAYPFSSISTDINSIYILTKRIELSSFLQRCDGIFVFVWCLSFFSYISLFIFFISQIIKKIFNLSDEKQLTFFIIPLTICASYFCITNNYYKFSSYEILKYVSNALIFIISIIILIFASIKKSLIKKDNKKSL